MGLMSAWPHWAIRGQRETQTRVSPFLRGVAGPFLFRGSHLPYPMRLGIKPIAIATTASTVTTKIAAASISTSFSMAQSPPMAGALCQVCTSLQRHPHQSRVVGGLGAPC